MGNYDKKKRLEFLLERQKAKLQVNYGVLFDECIEALGDDVTVFSNDKSKELYTSFQERIPFTEYARIDWSTIKNCIKISGLEEVADIIGENLVEVYWSYGDFPVIKTKFIKLLSAYDDLVAVSPDIFLYVPHQFVIEIFHEGEITLGYL